MKKCQIAIVISAIMFLFLNNIDAQVTLISLENKYYSTLSSTDLFIWERAILDSIQTYPDEFKRRKSFPIPPIVGGEFQLRCSIRDIDTNQAPEKSQSYELKLEADSDQVSINKILLLASGSIIRIRGNIPFPFESTDLDFGNLSGAVVRDNSGTTTNTIIKILQPLKGVTLYVIQGDSEYPLTFLVAKGTGKYDGIIYMHGKGSILHSDGTSTILP